MIEPAGSPAYLSAMAEADKFAEECLERQERMQKWMKRANWFFNVMLVVTTFEAVICIASDSLGYVFLSGLGVFLAWVASAYTDPDRSVIR